MGCLETAKTSYQSTLSNIPDDQRNRVLNLFGKYRLSVLASILPRLWAARFVGRVNLMRKVTGNDKRYLSDKITTYNTHTHTHIYIYIYMPHNEHGRCPL